MTTTMVRPLSVPWRTAALAVVVGVAIAANFAFLVGYILWVNAHQGGPFDYPIFVEATSRLTDGSLYRWDLHGYVYPYSPVFAWLFIPFATAGIWVWQAMHLLTVVLIRNWPIRTLVLLSVAFWMDTWEGNVGAFFMLAGYWAIRRNRLGSWAFIALCLMIPKPIYLPALVWMLWRQPENRVRFVVLLVIHTALVLATGYAFEWLQALPGASHDIFGPFNFMPSRVIGWWWWPIGLALSAVLVLKDHPGWAGATAALYGGTHIPLMLVMEPDSALRRLAAQLIPSITLSRKASRRHAGNQRPAGLASSRLTSRSAKSIE
jgi:hypothetical protein